MKKHILPTAIAGLGLAVLPLHADNHAKAETGADQPVAAQAEAAETISTYVVHLSGGG
ncbi:hypothetical protein [Sulfuriroseicoccus oceanibius]|uniref:Uncharacterized protein n=1 Tax=Sulfuriroseicoccus oceanibius TaxID=2707525 RepID=A0A6B3LCI7_9BACT|nr:hypothetical protein [Sulfuriroseicoccus oceanibius]QQL45999.1 hypothetical protein G3M56_005315 [Sulfuriroseicoccus oceanibius]